MHLSSGSSHMSRYRGHQTALFERFESALREVARVVNIRIRLTLGPYRHYTRPTLPHRRCCSLASGYLWGAKIEPRAPSSFILYRSRRLFLIADKTIHLHLPVSHVILNQNTDNDAMLIPENGTISVSGLPRLDM
jgi:hypothetical protein